MASECEVSSSRRAGAVIVVVITGPPLLGDVGCGSCDASARPSSDVSANHRPSYADDPFEPSDVGPARDGGTARSRGGRSSLLTRPAHPGQEHTSMTTVFLGRQPILDRNRRTY